MPRPFLDFLREHRGGATHDELTDALAQLPDAIADHTPTRGRPEGLPPAEEA